MQDADLCALAAASYDPTPAGTIIDWRDMRAVITDLDGALVITVRGTEPDSLANWERDASIWDERCTTHPRLGLCQAGALEAAEGVLPLLLPHITGRRVVVQGHSEGGTVAILIVAVLTDMGIPVELLVTWDSPKAGGLDLVALLSPVEIRQYVFSGSAVSLYPPMLDLHVRPPLIEIGEWTIDLIAAHSIERADEWMHAPASVSA